MLFKEFAGIDAFPICLNTKDPDEIVAHSKAICTRLRRHQPGRHLGAALLRDRGPARRELDIPVFHDDQHGTAVVVLAAFSTPPKLVGKQMRELKVVFIGIGAAGVAVTKMLMEAGVSDIIGCDREGALHPAQEEHEGDQEVVCPPHQPAEVHGQRRRSIDGRGRIPRPVGPGAVSATT